MAKPPKKGKLGGNVLKDKQIRKLRGELKKHGGLLILEKDLVNKAIINKFKPIYINGLTFEKPQDLFYYMSRKNFAGAYDSTTRQMILAGKKGTIFEPTELVAFHEKAHLLHFEELGEAYHLLPPWKKETYVFEKIWSEKRKWTKAELTVSLNYVNKKRKGAGIVPLNIKL